MGSEAQLLEQSRSPSKAASSSDTIALPRMVRVSLRPTLRTQIPSPLLPITIPRPESDKPLPAIHTDLRTVRRNTSATVSGVQHVPRLDRTPTSPSRTPNSASHAGEGFPIALGQSMSRRQSQHHRRSGHLSAAVELHRRSSIPFPVAGPSTVRIPESEVEMSEVPIRNIEPNRHSLPPIPVDKGTEAAADSVSGAESPPAYTV
ncbi:uncharacterized protein LAESUDRAFT_762921 [Laetiporus sulphureus 93-53]|uniref:Uncharacterized protein n=1 Tax=Laetiporus sulphureus 93-53 TaxID=1314785 RepID=A0A165C7V7_9APHY|nr:uncharacterized protein LAESUDRAFT_762921 [Laetiporus sulphureus 93-53]KZT02352.1 hypothetical protein LAESUDRAFT_762921 [Laetiporus sulphureus 93-53]